MIDANAAIANRLRRKEELIRKRFEEQRPKSEFVPKLSMLDRSMSPNGSLRDMPNTAEAIKQTILRQNSFNPPAEKMNQNQSKTHAAIKQAIENRQLGPSTNNLPDMFNKNQISRPKFQDAKPLSEINNPPPPPIFERERRDSNSSNLSRLSKRFRFFDRKKADNTAKSLLHRIKKPEGA